MITSATAMRQIVRMQFGSHLYGTSTPESDLDFKSVHVPDARAILLQKTKQPPTAQRQKAEREKNCAGEAEEERFLVQRFLALAAEGQTCTIDMLFAPEWAYTEHATAEWREIITNRHRLLTRRAAAFLGYARKQANKYGIKGSRVAAARNALAMLEAAVSRHGGAAKLGVAEREIDGLLGEHSVLAYDTTPHGQTVTLWDVCGRKMPFTASIKGARDIMARGGGRVRKARPDG